DLFTDKAVAMAVGDRASGISASPNGKLLSVAMGDSGTVALVDMATLRVVKTVRISGRNAERAVFAPDGGSVYASAEDSDSVDVGAGPSSMAFTADGSKLYVACSRSNEVSVIDVPTYKRTRTIPVAAAPSAIVISESPTLPRDGD